MILRFYSCTTPFLPNTAAAIMAVSINQKIFYRNNSRKIQPAENHFRFGEGGFSIQFCFIGAKKELSSYFFLLRRLV